MPIRVRGGGGWVGGRPRAGSVGRARGSPRLGRWVARGSPGLGGWVARRRRRRKISVARGREGRSRRPPLTLTYLWVRLLWCQHACYYPLLPVITQCYYHFHQKLGNNTHSQAVCVITTLGITRIPPVITRYYPLLPSMLFSFLLAADL